MNWKAVAAACALVVGSAGLAAERVTPFTGELGKEPVFDSMYVAAPQGVMEIRQGKMPLVGHAGKRAIQVKVNKEGDYWSLGFARGWTHFYLADYLPDGVLELTVCGLEGGETFNVGIGQDAARARKTTAHNASVPIAKYGTVSKEWQTLRVPLKDIVAADPAIDLDDCAKVLINNSGSVKPQTFYIAGIRFTTTSPETVYAPIKVDQLGYRPAMVKVAKISAPVTAFRVVDVATGKAVFAGQAKAFAKNDQASGDDIWEADFSSVTAPGKYRVEADGLAPSDPFEIRENVYDQLFVDAMRFYYLQRCNMALEPKYAGEQAHEACHMGDKEAKTVDGKETRDVTGGWHDAGDNNKYPAFLSNAVSIPLAIYDLRPEAFPDGQLNIPESGNGIPDILDEIQYELDWLLKMQITAGPKAGAVYDRLHEHAAQQGDKDGGRLQEPRRLLPPTDESTAYSAANWAQGARVMSRAAACREKSQRYLQAAELAWQRLLADKASGEMQLTAALAMFDATGKEDYAKVVARELDRVAGSDTWDGAMADRLLWAPYTTFLCNMALSQRDEMGIRDKARRIVKRAADHLAGVSLKDGYGSTLWIMDHYCWSSSANIGRLGYVCAIANQYAPNADYLRAAENTMHYMLGRNAVATSFVTRYGTRWTETFHSIYGNSNAAFLPTPAGYMPGGVNMQQPRGISAWPAKHYRPDPNNWTINEPAVYYNAPLVFLSGYFAELKPAK